eukprot:SAG25_NODE_10121_length_345_cov_0.841463_1_plen_41_part_01
MFWIVFRADSFQIDFGATGTCAACFGCDLTSLGGGAKDPAK